MGIKGRRKFNSVMDYLMIFSNIIRSQKSISALNSKFSLVVLLDLQILIIRGPTTPVFGAGLEVKIRFSLHLLNF